MDEPDRSEGGDRDRIDHAVDGSYEELHALASLLARRRGPALSPRTTSLVQETYLRLAGSTAKIHDREHFLAVASRAMRFVLVDQMRRRGALKRTGRGQQVPLSELQWIASDRDDEVLAVDEALDRLGELDERKARIVELRFFGGLSVPETAATLGISTATVKRDWALARAWLAREVRGE